MGKVAASTVAYMLNDLLDDLLAHENWEGQACEFKNQFGSWEDVYDRVEDIRHAYHSMRSAENHSDALVDLKQRTDNARFELRALTLRRVMLGNIWDTRDLDRLGGKIEGVNLVLGYIDEALSLEFPEIEEES